ncbi:MAG: shikimate dehydrogenase [Pseudomonadota bacterium]
MTDKYAVIGNPIGHSKSPIIHAAFARQTNQDISYKAILAPLDGFEATVQSLIAQGYKGANVTVPFKFQALNLVLPSNRALDEVAVNTLSFLGGEIRGDSTDGTGLIRDIKQNLGITISGKRILLLGAGGAAEGVLHPLLNEAPNSLVIANRTLDKAQSMVKKILANHAFVVSANAFDDMADAQFDIVINATSTGLTDTALPIPSTIFAKNCLAYDMMYGRETPFMAQARAADAQVADGLGMLVEQAAEAFYIWRKVRPDTQPVIQMVRALQMEKS